MADKKKAASAKKAPAKPRKQANGYVKSAPIKLGLLLTDNHKKNWSVGPVIGSGGFGDIYAACSGEKVPKNVDDYPYVVKVEPHENGPLFVEMHFYMRNAKLDDINAFKKSRKYANLGMPHFISSGSCELNGKKHRFLIIPRYGKDIWSFFLSNNRRIPEHTVLRLGIQMLQVLEYIHNGTYVHADIKGANILLGYGKGGESQAYLLDFGLASHYTTKDFKLDPKKMHNGTIEYTSRDAHNGVPTMRGDLEILGYNLIHWLGGTLPWENCLTNPVKVQEAKETYMKSVEASTKKSLSAANCPSSVLQFMKYVANMKYNDTPDYGKLCKYFEVDLKILGKSNSGQLEFGGVTKITNRKSSPVKPLKSDKPTTSRVKKSTEPEKRKVIRSDDDDENATPKKMKRSSIKSEEKPKKSGKTDVIVNNTIKTTSTGKTKKCYEFTVELDVSMDANVKVNVVRKNKKETDTPKSSSTTSRNNDDDDDVVPVSPNVTPSKRKRTVQVKGATPKVAVKTSTTIRRMRQSPRGSPKI